MFCCSAEKHPKPAGTEICSRTNQNQDEGPDPEHAHPSPISAEAAAHLSAGDINIYEAAKVVTCFSLNFTGPRGAEGLLHTQNVVLVSGPQVGHG